MNSCYLKILCNTAFQVSNRHTDMAEDATALLRTVRTAFCWFSLDVNGFWTLRHWRTSSETDLGCAFLHKQTPWVRTECQDPLYPFRWKGNTCRTGWTLPELTSDGLIVTGRQCYSLMSPDSVPILLIDASWCGECPKRDLMNWMWQNMTVMTLAQSWFGKALASTEKLTCMLLKTEHWRLKESQCDAWSDCNAISGCYRSRI